VKLFANHLTEVLSPYDNTLDQEVESKFAVNPMGTEKLSAFTTKELLNVITKLHPHKAPGLDRITALMVQKYHLRDFKPSCIYTTQ
jgi:hypothetical protein